MTINDCGGKPGKPGYACDGHQTYHSDIYSVCEFSSYGRLGIARWCPGCRSCAPDKVCWCGKALNQQHPGPQAYNGVISNWGGIYHHADRSPLTAACKRPCAPDKWCGHGKEMCRDGQPHWHGRFYFSVDGCVDSPHHLNGTACGEEVKVNLVVDPELQEEVREWLEPKCPVHGEGMEKGPFAPGQRHFLCGCPQEQGSEGDTSGQGQAFASTERRNPSDPSPPRDVAMEAAKHRGDDAWLAAIRFFNAHDAAELGTVDAIHELAHVIRSVSRAAIDKETERMRQALEKILELRNEGHITRIAQEALNRSAKP